MTLEHEARVWLPEELQVRETAVSNQSQRTQEKAKTRLRTAESRSELLHYCKVSRERVSGRARKWGCIISMGVPSPAGTGSHLRASPTADLDFLAALSTVLGWSKAWLLEAQTESVACITETWPPPTRVESVPHVSGWERGFLVAAWTQWWP